jgi:hypothetical protein
MSIPQSIDYALSDLDNIHGSVMVSLRTMNHAAKADVPKMRQALRERLRMYVDAALCAAPMVKKK